MLDLEVSILVCRWFDNFTFWFLMIWCWSSPIHLITLFPDFIWHFSAAYRSNIQSGYKTIRHADDEANKEYSALDESANGGYGNRAYDRAADLALMNQKRIRRRGSDSDDDLYRSRVPAVPPPRRGSWHEHETYEEEFKEEIEYERGPASDSSTEKLNKIPWILYFTSVLLFQDTLLTVFLLRPLLIFACLLTCSLLLFWDT